MLRAGTTAAALLAATLICGSAAAAEDAGEGGHLWVGLVGGTLGFGPEVGYRFTRHLGLRASGGFFGYDRNGEEDDLQYYGKVKLNSVGLLADVYPFGGSFRIAVGARSNGNRITAMVKPTEDIDIGDETYTPAEAGLLTGEVKFSSFSPVATLGWGGKLRSGLHFGIEAGVMMQGSPQIEVTSKGSSLEGTAAFAQFRAQLDKEVADAERDTSKYRLWPVIQLHFLYRF